MYKVEIFPKNEDFLMDLLTFLKQKSPEFNRDFSIDNILNDHDSLQIKNYLKKHSPITLKDVWGSTFQSQYRGNDQIYAISHTVESIEIVDDKYYGYVSPSDYGEIIDFDQGFLRPVYYKNENQYLIATFDIDFHIINNAT